LLAAGTNNISSFSDEQVLFGTTTSFSGSLSAYTSTSGSQLIITGAPCNVGDLVFCSVSSSLDGADSTSIYGATIVQNPTVIGLIPHTVFTGQFGITSIPVAGVSGRGIMETVGVESEGCSLSCYITTGTAFSYTISPYYENAAVGGTQNPTTIHSQAVFFVVPASDTFYQSIGIPDQSSDCEELESNISEPVNISPDNSQSDDEKSVCKDDGLILSPSFINTISELLIHHKRK